MPVGGQGYHAITVNAICPGYVRAGRGVAAQMTKAGPRSGEEIAPAAVFLAPPESGGITGQALSVDGGFVTS